MADPTGEADRSALRLDFDRRLMLQFRGSTITSDAGLLAYRELDDALHLTDTAANTLADVRTGKNGRHRLGVAPCKRVELGCLRWQPRQSLASSRVPSLAWRPVTAAAKRRQGGCRPECQ